MAVGERIKKKKVCPMCQKGIARVDYKDTALLKEFLLAKGQLIPRRRSGMCAKHQRRLSEAVKNARELALLPYIAEHTPGGRFPQ
jgi:small subunit ribosomal protein S18